MSILYLMACLVLLCYQHVAKGDKERASDVRVAHTPTAGAGAGYRVQLALMYNASVMNTDAEATQKCVWGGSPS